MARVAEETLLIVETHPTVCRTLARFLGNDYRVLGAKSGADAWVILVKENVDPI
jgi:DNA-binding response OmpR family regulator